MRSLPRWCWLIVAVLLIVGGWGIWSAVRPRRTNLLIITLDTTRADRLGPWGGPAGLTPVLDELAAHGIVFEHAYAPVPITLPSHASMMTGLFPPEHGLRVNNGINRLGSDFPVLAEVLKKEGYRTGAFLGAFVLDRKFGLDRGFEHYDDNLGETPAPQGGGHSHRMRDGQRVVDSALRWLDENGSDPFLCWVHLFDPHTPYRAREELFGDRFRDREYDAGIAYVDLQCGRILEVLRQRGLDERTVVIIAGDHGESLGEHGEREHGFTIYNATLQVPLIARLPGKQAPVRRVAATVSLVDLFPTALAALGLPIPECSGRNLLPACHGEPLTPLAAYAESDRPLDEAGWSPLRGLVTERWKYIRSAQPELYDLAADPHERNNLAESEPARRDEFELALEEREGRFVLREAPAVLSSPHERRTLASLGYAGGNSPNAAGNARRADIKEMLPHYNAYTDAQKLMSGGKFEEATVLLEPVVKAAPEYFQAWYNLGVARQQLDQMPQAESAFERAVEIDGNAWARIALGMVYLKQAKLDKAAAQFEAVVEFEPERAEAHYFMGEVYRRQGRRGEARSAYRKALDADPDFTPARQALIDTQ